MKYEIKPMTRFKKDLKLVLSQGYHLDEINCVINQLAEDVPLDETYRDHPLHGNWSGYRECHIKPDWLLIYKKDEADLILYLVRTGSHSEMF